MNVNYISSHSMFMENVPLKCLLSLENETSLVLPQAFRTSVSVL